MRIEEENLSSSIRIPESTNLESLFASEGLSRDVVSDLDSQVVVAGLQLLEWDQAAERHLLAVERAQGVLAVFLQPRDLLVLLRDHVLDLQARPQGRLVNRNVVDLHVDAERLVLLE